METLPTVESLRISGNNSFSKGDFEKAIEYYSQVNSPNMIAKLISSDLLMPLFHRQLIWEKREPLRRQWQSFGEIEVLATFH